MINFIKKLGNNLAYIIIGLILAVAGTAYAIQVSVPQATQKGDLPTGLTTGNYQLLHPGSNGQVLSASSTSSTGLAWVANSAAAGATTTIQTGSSGITLNGPSFIFASGTDTNLGLNISGSGSTITYQPTWTGTLAAGRLNSNVVQGVTNDTNVTGTISAQNLTLGWTGNLSVARGGTGTTTWQSGSVPYYNGTNLTENNAKFLWDSTNLFLKTPIADLGGQVFNVKAYGAKGDGSTNDTTAFNSAISAAHSAGGGAVYLPTGNYKLSTSPTLFSDIKLSGTGSSSIVTLAAGAKLDTTNLSNIDFRDFSVDGHLQSTSTDYGILVSGNSTNVTIDHVRLNTNCFNIFVNAAANSTTSKVSITNVYAKGQGYCDVIGGGPNNSTNARVTDIDFHDNTIVQDDTTGGTDKEAVNLVAANFYNFHDNTTYGGLLFGTEQQPDTDSAIKNNFVHNALGAARAALGVVVQSNATTTGNALSFTGNTIDSGFIDVINNTSAVPLTNLIISGNNINATGTVTSSGEAGIRVSNAKGAIITNNIVASSSADGIWLTNVTNSKIDTNYVNNSQGVGIKEDGTSNNNEFTNNSLSNNAGGNYSTVGSADTLFTVSNGVGIGTDSPVSLLALNGSTPAFSINDSSQTWPNGLYEIRDQNKTLQFFNKLLGSSASEVFELSGATTTVTALTVSPTSGGVFNNVQKVYLPSSGNGWFNTGGNFGIGSTSPVATLSVQGTSTLPTADILDVASSSAATYLQVTASGNVNLPKLGACSNGLIASTGGTIACNGSAFLTSAVTSVSGAGSVISSGGNTPTIQLQNLTTGDVLFGQGNSTIATSSTFYYTNSILYASSSNFTNASITNLTLLGLSATTQCLHATNGVVTGTGSDCGAGGGTPGGSDTQIQFNNAGSFGGNAGFTYSSSTQTLSLGTLSTDANIVTPNGSAGSDAGTLNIFTGNGDGSGYGGYLQINAGTGGATGNGGNLNILGGNGGSTSGNGGNLYLQGGLGTGGGTNGHVIIGDPVNGNAVLDAGSIPSGNKTFTFPNASGTFALGTGTNGYIASWNATNTLTTGILLDNGTVAGVNATSSTVSLNVKASSTQDAFNVASSSGTSQFIIKSSGNVGLGTTSPVSALALNAGQFSGPNGTNSAPTYSFTSNTNSGMYQAAAGNLAFSLGGTQSLQLDSTNLFGPNANAYMLKNLTGDSTTQPIIIPDRSTTNTGFAAGTAGNINAIVGGKEITRWTTTGFGVGSSTPIGMLVSQGFSGSTTPLFIVASSTGAQYFNITSAGLVGVGTSTASALLTLEGTAGSTNDLLDIASSTGQTLVSVSANTNPIFSVGSTTPVANFTVVASSTSATTTIQFGDPSASVGTCMKWIRDDGSKVYVHIAAGSTSFSISTTSCGGGLSGF